MMVNRLKVGDKVMNSHSKRISTISSIEKVRIGKHDGKENYTMVFTLEGPEPMESHKWNQFYLLANWELVK